MGLLRLFRTRERSTRKPPTATLYPGNELLEVVGEWYHQDALWTIVGGRRDRPVGYETQATLIPESPDSEYPEAIRVVIDGKVVGSLSREHAAVYRPGLLRLMESSGHLVAIKSTIVGRHDPSAGHRGVALTIFSFSGADLPDSTQVLQVLLHHDPSTFGITPQELRRATIRRGFRSRGGFGLRTGFGEAMATDREDDSYDLSWATEIFEDEDTAIEKLRVLLETEHDPIDRHYMMCELESRLYRARDDSPSALDEYDVICRQHDAEMDATIRPALLEKFGLIPVVDMYRQEAIRWQKARDWKRAHDWAERGITVYGEDAARPEVVDDLHKRSARASQKISEASIARPTKTHGTTPSSSPALANRPPAMETLTCASCGGSFERPRTRGRKPRLCPTCRAPARTARN